MAYMSKDQYGHFKSTNHDRASRRKKVVCYQNTKSAYVTDRNSFVLDYVSDSPMSCSWLVSSAELNRMTTILHSEACIHQVGRKVHNKLQVLHSETCGCKSFMVQFVSVTCKKEASKLNVSVWSIIVPHYKFRIRCADHATFSVTVALHKEWSES